MIVIDRLDVVIGKNWEKLEHWLYRSTSYSGP